MGFCGTTLLVKDVKDDGARSASIAALQKLKVPDPKKELVSRSPLSNTPPPNDNIPRGLRAVSQRHYCSHYQYFEEPSRF